MLQLHNHLCFKKMREFGDDSSAGSTPPPRSRDDDFSPLGYFLNSEFPSPTPAADAGAADGDDDLWRDLAQDGWCFSSDKHHGQQHQHHGQHHQQQQQLTFRSAASEPFRQNNACVGGGGARRPPRPSSLLERSNKRVENDAQESRNQFDCINNDQEWNDSVANLIAQSLASKNDKDEISSTESDEEEVQSDLPANEKRPPEVGMEFFSEDEAYEFYKNYADEVGFSVRKGKVQRLANGAIRKRDFLCSRQGFKWRKMPNDQTKKYNRKETRTGCKASIQLTVEDGKWVVSNFISDHNHELGEEQKGHLIDSSSNYFSKTAFEGDDDARMVEENEATESIRLQEVNSFNCLNNRSSNVLQPEDVHSLMNCFLDLQVKDPSFFYTIQVDSESRMTNIFWRDCRSWMDYGFFGDAIVFDTTCRIDNVVYASIWGLNHHHQCVLFGCALLLDETLESFVWLFRVFMVAMDNRQPKTIYSMDESQEIADAVASVFSKTQYRLGVSIIFENAKRRLSRHFEQPGFEDIFKKCLFNCQSKEEYESQSDLLLSHYNLRENSWLATLHNLWEKWSHLFRKKSFSAGIELFLDNPNTSSLYQSSTSEIMSLADFVQWYVKETQKRRLEELHEDLRCSKMVSVRSRKGMEKHAEDLYTCTMFEKFQDELLDSLSLAIEEVTSSSSISAFKLTEEGRKKEDIVMFDSSNSSVNCSCGKFESIGILCGHCIKVLNAKNIFQIPTQYILKRWTKSAKEGEALDGGSENDHLAAEKSQKQLTSYARKIIHKTLNIVIKSIGIEESRNMVESYLDLASKKADEILKEKGIKQIESTSLDLECNTNCAVNSVRYLRNHKIGSNSSCINQEQGSKGTMKSTYKKQKTCKNNTRQIDFCTQGLMFQVDQSVKEQATICKSGGLMSSQLGGNNAYNEGTIVNNASQAES